MPSDIDIAQSVKMKPIQEIAARAGLEPEDLELYGKYKAKITFERLAKVNGENKGKLILVTAMTPTPAGEGKTTLSIGLTQAFNRAGHNSLVAIREPSLGPVFGVKGGATGGGWAQVVPMEDINLHFTGDIHAVTVAHNLLLAMLDNHIFQSNALDVEWRNVPMRRIMDSCDRALRNTMVGLGGPTHGVPRPDGFDISAASEIMAILGLCSDLKDLKARLGRVIAAYSRDGQPVTAQDLKAVGAMTAVLRDAAKPNLVQTLEGTPALIHAGSFGNVAHGCSSIIATCLGLSLSDYFVTEAGFGSELGAEKFFNIKCRTAGLKPDAVVISTTIRALKYQAGVQLADTAQENVAAVEAGLDNLAKHIENIKLHGITPVVGINKFTSDTDAEVRAVQDRCAGEGARAVEVNVWAKGGEGGLALVDAVREVCDQPKEFRHLYPVEASVEEKLETIATKIYGAAGIQLGPDAVKSLARLKKLGYDKLPICMAKTQNSLSDNTTLKGRPTGFTTVIRDLKVSAGAGFIVAYAGNILTMFGFPEHPAAENIDVTEDGTITGLF
ncbi:MAG: formate--tetrahydrofolate ligase [Armatimonadetes bacterium CG_4_8_14_3_um_filter_66_20]|nr:MAG: formate--tetrahydrofolate ligase [Armatimonadetes bacterium CG_4_8_14_3_um_filter_66_20]